MKTFTATLSINKHNTANNKYEFRWEGEDMRTNTQELDLVIEAEDEIDVGSLIQRVSENTVTILDIRPSDARDLQIADEAEKTLDDYAADYANMCIPVQPREILETMPISVGHN